MRALTCLYIHTSIARRYGISNVRLNELVRYAFSALVIDVSSGVQNVNPTTQFSIIFMDDFGSCSAFLRLLLAILLGCDLSNPIPPSLSLRFLSAWNEDINISCCPDVITFFFSTYMCMFRRQKAA